ncbi:MAG: hypothetical protein ABH868_02010 [bacterium]
MNLKNSHGLTLIEIVLAITVLVMAVIPLMKMLGDSLRGSQTFSDISIATQLAQELMEEIKSKRWDELSSLDGSPAPNGSWPFGPDAGEGTPAAYDDVDDYNTAPLAYDVVDGKFTRTVEVIYVNVPHASDPATITPTLPLGTTSAYKRITITIDWTGKNPNAEPLFISTIRANYRGY